jgi:hypothetical protein
VQSGHSKIGAGGVGEVVVVGCGRALFGTALLARDARWRVDRRDRHLAGRLVYDEFEAADVATVNDARTRTRFRLAVVNREAARRAAPGHRADILRGKGRASYCC